MTSKKRLLAVAMAAVLLLSTVASAGAVGSTADDSVANDALVVAVEQAGNDGATVTVTHRENGSAVENASVIVETEGNGTYEGADDYTTDENGTVDLPAPEETVTVEVTAVTGNLTGETTATLTAAEDEKDGKKSTFGQMVSSFIQQMLNAGSDDGALGQAVSEFVTSNNPGSEKKPDHAGKPDDAGKPDHTGRPDHAGKSGGAGESGSVGQQNATDENDPHGPPERVGQSDDGDGEDDDDGKKKGHGKDERNGKGR